MEEYIVKDGKRLRLGYTTGSCAAAAAKAAAWMLLTGHRKEQTSILTPKGIRFDLSVLDIQMTETAVSCAIEKDGGDDPDITKGAHIVATVSKSRWFRCRSCDKARSGSAGGCGSHQLRPAENDS